MAAAVGISMSQHESSSDVLATTSSGLPVNDDNILCINGSGEELVTSGYDGDSGPDASRTTSTSGTLANWVNSSTRHQGDDDGERHELEKHYTKTSVVDKVETVSGDLTAGNEQKYSSSTSASKSQSQYHSIQQLSRPSSNGAASYDIIVSPDRVAATGRELSTDGGRRRGKSRIEEYRYEEEESDIDNKNEQTDDETRFYRRHAMTHRKSRNVPDEVSTTSGGPETSPFLRKRVLSPIQSFTGDHVDKSSNALRGSVQTSWSSSSSQVALGASEWCDAVEAKRARVENIINSMQVTSTPPPPGSTSIDIYTSGLRASYIGRQESENSRQADIDESAMIESDGPEGTCSESALACSGHTTMDTGELLGQRRGNRRKQYVPQHQNMNSHAEHFRSDMERSDDTDQSDSYRETSRHTENTERDYSDEDDIDIDDHISEEETKRFQTEAVREGLRRVEQRLASMRQKFLGMSRDDDIIVDVESHDAADVGNNVTSDVNRNEIRRLVAGTWFRSSAERVQDEVSSDEDEIGKKKERISDGRILTGSNNNNNNNNNNNSQLEKLAAMLKAEISDSVGSLVDDIVRTFVDRYFSRRAANRKSVNMQERERELLRSGSNNRTKDDSYDVSRLEGTRPQSSPRSPGAFSDDVSSGYIDEQIADDEDRIAKLTDTESELRSPRIAENIRKSLPSLSQSNGAMQFPFPVSAVGDEETMRQSAARLVAYRQALAAAYLDSAFTHPEKTAFGVPRSTSHRQQSVTSSAGTPSQRLFAPHPYYPSTVTRFDANQTAIPFVKEPEQTEAIPLIVNTMTKKKRTKVTDTRLSPRAARALLHESLQQHISEPRLDQHHQQLAHHYSPHHLNYESHQQQQQQHTQHLQQPRFDSPTNNTEMRIRSTSPVGEIQQHQMYDRRVQVHHQRSISSRHQQMLLKQNAEEQGTYHQYDRHTSVTSGSMSATRPEVDSSGLPTSSLHEAFHHRPANSHQHHHQQHHHQQQHHQRFFSPPTASHQPLPPAPASTMPPLVDINHAQKGLSFPHPLAPIPTSSTALEQHIQAIYVAAAVAAAAHSASRGASGHTSSSMIGSVNSSSGSGSCRDIHSHHSRSSSMVVGAAGHHGHSQQQTGASAFGETTNNVVVRPEVAELNACLVGGRTGCGGGRMLMKHNSSSASYDQLMMQGANYDSMATSTLTPMHLRKAKLMFFYVRYPSSSVLKEYFPDVRFNKNNTAQLVKWFSNFREFFYIQMEKYARQAIADGVKSSNELVVTSEAEIYRVLILHYNRNNQIEVPDSFRFAIQAALREFFMSIAAEKDQEQSWKKAIYKVIARLDEPVPEYFKSANWLEQLADC